MKIKYSQLTISELELFGCSFPSLSKHSMKVSVDNEIVGFVAIEDIPLKLKIYKSDSKNVVEYKQSVNKRNTFYLRKIMFSPKYEKLLFPLFQKVNDNMPYNYSIWCKPQIWDTNHYIDKIGGFLPPAYHVQRNILLFSLNV